MNGAEHYREAERLLNYAALDDYHYEDPTAIAAAQVHATLAQVAATVLNDGRGGMNGDTRREWLAATRPAGGER